MKIQTSRMAANLSSWSLTLRMLQPLKIPILSYLYVFGLIRGQSWPILAQITGWPYHLIPTIIRRPYRGLLLIEERIKSYYDRLKARWQAEDERLASIEAGSDQSSLETIKSKWYSQDKQSGTSTSTSWSLYHGTHESNKVNRERLMDSVHTYRDMRCLVEFIDSYVTPVVKRFESVDNRSIINPSFVVSSDLSIFGLHGFDSVPVAA